MTALGESENSQLAISRRDSRPHADRSRPGVPYRGLHDPPLVTRMRCAGRQATMQAGWMSLLWTPPVRHHRRWPHRGNLQRMRCAFHLGTILTDDSRNTIPLHCQERRSSRLRRYLYFVSGQYTFPIFLLLRSQALYEMLAENHQVTIPGKDADQSFCFVPSRIGDVRSHQAASFQSYNYQTRVDIRVLLPV